MVTYGLIPHLRATPDAFGSVLGQPILTFLGSHCFKVMALGSCMKWPITPNVLCDHYMLMNSYL
jgi:hypothetical protein